MQRIDFIERLGTRVAAISDRSDGDCSHGAADGTARNAYLASLSISPELLVTARQVHGTDIFTADESCLERGGVAPARPSADAILTTSPRVAMGISVADCVPVWLCVSGFVAGAIIHAGRQGTMQAITHHTARTLLERFNLQPNQIHAWIGPSAGPCCYEVSEPMAAEAEAVGVTRCGRNLDLWTSNQHQLIALGVPSAQIGISGECTICSGRYHSYRAQAPTARNLAILQL
jgi:YfiH family protein